MDAARWSAADVGSSAARLASGCMFFGGRMSALGWPDAGGRLRCTRAGGRDELPQAIPRELEPPQIILVRLLVPFGDRFLDPGALVLVELLIHDPVHADARSLRMTCQRILGRIRGPIAHARRSAAPCLVLAL